MTSKFPSGVSDAVMVKYDIVLQSRYAAERAYHIVKSNADLKDLFSFVQLGAQDRGNYYNHSQKRHHEFISPSTLMLTFKPENESRVIQMLQKHGRDLYHVHKEGKHTHIDAVRSQIKVLYMDFTN